MGNTESAAPLSKQDLVVSNVEKSKNEVLIRVLQPALLPKLCAALVHHGIYVTAISEQESEALVWIEELKDEISVTESSLFGFGISRQEVYKPKGSKRIKVPGTHTASEVEDEIEKIKKSGKVVTAKPPLCIMSNKPRYIYLA